MSEVQHDHPGRVERRSERRAPRFGRRSLLSQAQSGALRDRGRRVKAMATGDGNQPVKLLLSYDPLPERGEEYFRYVLGEFVPALEHLGLTMSEAWHTAYGSRPPRPRPTRLLVLGASVAGLPPRGAPRPPGVSRSDAGSGVGARPAASRSSQ